MLNCCICSTTSAGDNDFCCPTCARVALYPSRIKHAKTLLEKNALRRQVETVTSISPDQEQGKHTPHANSVVVQEGSKQYQYDQFLAETVETRERIERIDEQSRLLREQIEEYKAVNAERKASLAIRRADVASVGNALTRSYEAIAPIKKSIRKTHHRHDILYGNLVSARVYLCSEAAALMGLQQRQGPQEEGKTAESYILGGGDVMDLRDLNNYSHSEVSAALHNISHLLFLACYYLSVRLPAELAIPGESRPSPTIYQPFSSYTFYNHRKQFSISSSDVSMFGATNLQNDHGPFPRARPLVLDRRLVLLAREDPSQYSLCVEGMSLLAWNIAWLCRNQGIQVASENWEEVCAIGRNLWLLLDSAPKVVQAEQAPPSASILRNSKKPTLKYLMPNLNNVGMDGPGNEVQNAEQAAQDILKPLLGKLSHGTVCGFLGPPLATGPVAPNNTLGPWKFASPVQITDKLKSLLLAELSGLEWELLDEDDFENEEAEVGGEVLELHGIQPSVQQAAYKHEPGRSSGPSSPSNGEARRGTSGWTKLKSRAKS